MIPHLIALLLALLLLATPARAFDPDGGTVSWHVSDIQIAPHWTWADSSLMAAFLITRAADWSQTRRIDDTPDLQESNPIMGDHPSDGRVDSFFTWTTAATVGLSLILPPEWRRSMLAGFSLANTVVVANNHRLGLRVGFKY